MNTALWIAQGILALVFGTLGTMKVAQRKHKLEWELFWTQDMPRPVTRAIGSIETLGATGVILPMLTGIWPRLTSLAAAGLAFTMIGAIGLHVKRRGWTMILVNLMLFALAIFVAYGRWGKSRITDTKTFSRDNL